MGRRPEELATAVAKIGTNATDVQGDVSSFADLDRLYAQIETEKGTLDILMANAGIAKYAPIGLITFGLTLEKLRHNRARPASGHQRDQGAKKRAAFGNHMLIISGRGL